MQFNFCPSNSFRDLTANASVDILGVCTQVSDMESYADESRKCKFRDVYLKNEDVLVNAVLLDKAAELFEISTMPMVAVKGAKIDDNCGFKFAFVEHASQIFLNPDIEEARQIKNRYKTDIKAETLRRRTALQSPSIS